MRLRIATAGLMALGVLVAGCGAGTPSADPTNAGTGTIGTVEETPTEETTAPVPDLTCASVRNAAVSATALPLSDYGPVLVTLSNGSFADSDGTKIDLLDACGVGDVSGDGVVDVVAGVKVDPDGTGTFYDLVVWLGTSTGAPALGGSESLGDRNPITSVSISGGVVTVIYFTRTAEVPLAGLNVQRTATYVFAMPGLTETGHTDTPCSGPCLP